MKTSCYTVIYSIETYKGQGTLGQLSRCRISVITQSRQLAKRIFLEKYAGVIV
ncbi:MAG: hypothetical protein PHT07_24430 [Paludibacter sp.]|nr:hypothetical protein [Paludibacter sp.]